MECGNIGDTEEVFDGVFFWKFKIKRRRLLKQNWILSQKETTNWKQYSYKSHNKTKWPEIAQTNILNKYKKLLNLNKRFKLKKNLLNQEEMAIRIIITSILH